MSELAIHMFPCLKDNYGYLLHDADSGVTAAVDTPDAAAILAELETKGWRLTHILNTHHHADHAGGNLELKRQTGCTIVGPRADAARIPGIDVQVGEGDVVAIGAHRAVVFDTPGHTRGHIVYYFADAGVAFVGDTLFALGCGRLFEGTPEQMWSSLSKLLRWPDATRLYCAHEYTQSNARFALTVEPGNEALQQRAAAVASRRAANLPTVPSTLGEERATNPFLRAGSAGLRATIGLPNASDVEVFARTRALKDAF
ncbi:MAG TPA: hydroxyacylglutathione hydrolase [Gammaproteobacteria bacterium]|jgi:hydroxyacylglutathione hydrolase|nr:hydroxyacylglutathione hydrolase [Gammaproteobacteria bacterium]